MDKIINFANIIENASSLYLEERATNVIKKEDKATSGSSNSSTKYTHTFHELACAVGFLGHLEGIKNTGSLVKVILKLEKDGKLISIDSSGKKVSIKNYVYFDVKAKENNLTEIINDAKNIVSKFKLKEKQKVVSRVYWTGPTNSKGIYGAADIVLNPKSNGEKLLSLKYKSGQLKNLGVGSFNTILGLPELSLETHPQIPKLIQNWKTIVLKSLKGNSRVIINKVIYNGISWKEYQNLKFDDNVDKKQLYKDNGLIYSSVDKYNKVAYFLKKIVEKTPVDEWKQIRNSVLNKLYSDFYKKYDLQVKKGLMDLFKAQLSVNEKSLYYISDGGKKIFFIPGLEDFKAAEKKMILEHDIQPTGTGLVMSIYVKSKSKKPIMEINITFRFPDGQMYKSLPQPKSAEPKLYIDNLNDLFN